jgi:hypothetical protein
MSPYASEDLTLVIEQKRGGYAVLESRDTAEHEPDYRELGRFPVEQEAQKFLDSSES